MSPLVYAIVLNRNGEKWLQRCLGSLLESSYANLRVILADNGSADGSLALARKISSQIEILAHPSNLGFCEGNNLAIRKALDAGAGYVVLLNNDLHFERDWLDRIIGVAEQNPELGILGPVQLAYDGDEFNSWTETALRGRLDEIRASDQPGKWLDVEWVEGSCLLARRAVFERIGLLDPIFFIFFEEIDFCRRARAAGFDIALVPSSKVHHYRGGYFATPALAQRRSFLFLRNSMIYNSSDPTAALASNLRALLLSDAVHLKQALNGGGGLLEWMRANAALFASLPAVYRKWRSDRRMLARLA